MAQKRDYAYKKGKNKKSSAVNKKLLLSLAGIIIIGFGAGLYYLKHQATEQNTTVPVANTEKQKPKSQLPSRPEETWSYIKELESRTVHTDPSAIEKSAQLTEKQKEQLKLEEEREKQKAKLLEEERNKGQQQATTPETKPTESTQTNEIVTTDESKAEQERKLAEQKKLAEQRKKEEERKKAEQAKKAEEQRKAELAKTEQKKAESKATVESKPAVTGKFGLQCGAFKDRASAESLQGRLAMTGLNATVVTSGEWNRVRIGPIGDRTAAEKAKQQASSVASCVLMTM